MLSDVLTYSGEEGRLGKLGVTLPSCLSVDFHNGRQRYIN